MVTTQTCASRVLNCSFSALDASISGKKVDPHGVLLGQDVTDCVVAFSRFANFYWEPIDGDEALNRFEDLLNSMPPNPEP